jgi:hypothetical protein
MPLAGERVRRNDGNAPAWEVIMRRVLLITCFLGAMAVIFFFGAMAIIVSATGSLSAGPPGKDMAVVDIPDKTKLEKTTLQGRYIFAHDDERMARGEPCFYVYEYSHDPAGRPALSPDKLVASFHCEPVQRQQASHIVLTYGMAPDGQLELREIQFVGSSEGHRVP